MKTLLIALAGALALAAAATAQGLPAMDTNGDGAVDRAEFDAFVQTPSRPWTPTATAT